MKSQSNASMLTIAIILSYLMPLQQANVSALLRRCYQCRSRGLLGSCKDPFIFNASDVINEPGLSAIPCASGWCGKVIEGGGAYAVDDYDQAIQRMCVQRGPNDNQDRCAETVYNFKKVFMCFCEGDLCNGAKHSRVFYSKLITIMTSFSGVVLLLFIGQLWC